MVKRQNHLRGPTKHKGANLFKNARISTTRDHKGPQRTQGSEFIYKYKDFNNKGAQGTNLLDIN